MSYSSHKVKPASGSGGLPPEVVIGGAVFGVILIALALIAAAINRGNTVEPTPLPFPTYASSGEKLAVGDILYTQEDVAFSAAAGVPPENPSLTTGACGAVAVMIKPDSEDEVIYLVEGDYWVYASIENNPTAHGWLPFDNLLTERPEGCGEGE